MNLENGKGEGERTERNQHLGGKEQEVRWGGILFNPQRRMAERGDLGT